MMKSQRIFSVAGIFQQTLAVFLLVMSFAGFGQVAYFENFGTGCSTGTLATTFGWTNTNTGANEANANIWYVSAAENGVGPGNCGVGCGGANSRTLHVGAEASAGGDLGASYFESSAFFCSFLGLCSVTDKRIESPTINCTGLSNITFSFDYIENGEGANDNATVWYSANNGSTWTQIDDPPKSTLCSGQGLWATRSMTLPASADNNPTVKVAFRWVNNGNGTGVDPSFAVDNVLVEVPVVLSVDILDMKVTCSNGMNSFQWTTKSEENLFEYRVYCSSDAVTWDLLGSVAPGNTSSGNTYHVEDLRPGNNLKYYYLEETDNDGLKKSFAILSSVGCTSQDDIVIYPNPSSRGELTISSNHQEITSVEIYSMDGKQVYRNNNPDQARLLRLQTELNPGEYIVRVLCSEKSEILRWVITP